MSANSLVKRAKKENKLSGYAKGKLTKRYMKLNEQMKNNNVIIRNSEPVPPTEDKND